MTNDTRDNRKTVTRSLNEGLHPSNMPTDRMKQYLPGDVDDDDAARVHNPHEWSDPDRTWRERIIPQTTAGKIAAAAVGVVVFGLTAYLWPIIGPLFQSPTVIVLSVLVSAFLLVWLHGNQAGMNRYKDLEKWVRFEGDDAKVVAVERIDDESDDGLPLFRPIKRLSYGGFNTTYFMRRDLPFKTSRLKRYPDDDGTDPVTDAGNWWTYTVETDTLGTFHLTDTDGLEWARAMDSAERYATSPKKLDQEKWDQADRLINELFREIRNLRDELEMVREHVETTTDLRDELHVPEIEGTVRLLQELRDVAGPAPRRSRRDRTEDQTPINAPVPQTYQHTAPASAGSDSEGDSE